jgi:hypothetical protein
MSKNHIFIGTMILAVVGIGAFLVLRPKFQTQTVLKNGRPVPRMTHPEMKPLEKDIPLAEGIQRANDLFSDMQPLTEQEVFAAVKAIRLMYPDIETNVYQTYTRIVTDRVLPKGMFFRRIQTWGTPSGTSGTIQVDWLDLCLEGEQRTPTPEERKKLLASLPKNWVVNGDDLQIPVGAFVYRIRSRFVSIINRVQMNDFISVPPNNARGCVKSVDA